MRMTRKFSSATAVISGLGLGVLATYLLFRQQPGVGYTLLVAALVSVLVGLGYLHRSTPLPANAWLVVPLLFFSGMVALHTNSTITILNILAGLGILGLLLTTWNRQVLARFVVLGYALAAVLAAASIAVRPFLLLADAAA